MPLQKLLIFSDPPTGAGEDYVLPGEKLSHGNPRQTLWLQRFVIFEPAP